jgi:hypothetical protein
MKKRRNLKEIDNISRQNPVAKYARQFNKAQTFADKSKYRRKAKHVLMRVIGNAFCLRFSFSTH